MLALLALALQEPIAIPDGMLQPALAVAQSRKAAEDAQSAWEAGEAAQALGLFRTAAELRPMHGGLLVQQARAAAAAGEKEEALTALRRAAAMGFGFDLVEDEALTSLREDESFPKILAQFESNRKPLVRSEVAFRASLSEQLLLYAEGIAHDPKSGDFFLSSFGYHVIVRVHREDDAWVTERYSELYNQPRGSYGIAWHVNHLHVGTGAAFGKRRSRGGQHFLLDDEGRVMTQENLDAQLLGDLTLTGQLCDAVFTDPQNGQVLFAPDGGGREARILIPTGVLPNPQGIVCYPGEQPLIVLADYAAGVFAFPLSASEELRELKGPKDECLLGIDGLARHGDDLIAIQNGIGVHRVLRLRLDAKHERITEVEVLERNHPEHGEPTLGVVVGNDFYYVANAPWGLAEGEEPPPAVVLRLPLN